jgi:plasmid stability protein
MPNLSIKDVPDDLAEALRQRAARNHRSLQGELMAIIERAASGSEAQAPAEALAPGRGSLRRGWKTLEQIHAEHLERFPRPFTEGPMSVDIIRQDRDRR